MSEEQTPYTTQTETDLLSLTGEKEKMAQLPLSSAGEFGQEATTGSASAHSPISGNSTMKRKRSGSGARGVTVSAEMMQAKALWSWVTATQRLTGEDVTVEVRGDEIVINSPTMARLMK